MSQREGSTQIEALFRKWLAPLVSLTSTLLLFATFVFHYHYFGAANRAADFFALDGRIRAALYIYGAMVLLASLIRFPADWEAFVALMVFLGSALISVAYTALFWMHPVTLSWQEILAQLYYLLEAVLSLVLVILLLTQEAGTRWAVTPRLSGVPGALKALGVLVYVVGGTLILDRGCDLAPDAVTSRVNLYGALGLEVLARLTMWRERIENERRGRGKDERSQA
ncbi:MAG: hypothetical protein GVY30_06390 [Chloroflexi bacterium]|nr:hypothetical protein [Chloroflexota bacterium]